jgi:glycoside/pentoside/hexuronide:cation symporter, GPH family
MKFPDADASVPVAGPLWAGSAPGDRTRPGDRVGFWEKTVLGAGYLPIYFGNAGIKGMALPFFQMVLGLNPALLGLVLAIPQCCDAVTDPLVGKLSDNCHTRFGRRRPFIVAGAIAQALVFGSIWMAPAGWGPTATLGYLAAALILFYTAFSFYSVPLMSLTYEMTPDYQERTRVMAFTGFFAKLAELTYSWMFWGASLAVFGTIRAGVRVVGWGVGIVVMGLVGMLPGLCVRERYYRRATRQQRVAIGPTLRAALGNRAFTVLIALLLCQVIASMLASNLDYYLLVYHVCGGSLVEGTKWKGMLSTGYALVGMASIYPISRLANRFGKRSTLGAIFGVACFGAVAKWFLFNPGNPWKILLDPLLCAPVYPALQILIPSMIADVCDDDELRFGLRREGMLAAFSSWIQKAGYALSAFGSGLVISLIGFDSTLGAAQPPQAIFAMRVILVGSTVAWAVLSIGLLAVYPLTQTRAYEIRAALEARRGTV